jgi:DNA-directed RNA polymerase specialized sigma24 family protein
MSQATLGDFAGREPETPDALEVLSETYRADYLAVEVEGERPTDRAQERDVAVATVCRNVSVARERVEEAKNGGENQ